MSFRFNLRWRVMFASATLLLVPLCAAAQVEYDAVNRAYFVVGGTDNTISSDISLNDVFIGKNNATDFTTLLDPITLTVTEGATLTHFGNVYPTGYFLGLNAFGVSRVNITGGNVLTANAFEGSTLDIQGGVLDSVYNYANVTIAGGQVNYVENNANLTVTAGNITQLFTQSFVTTQMTGGTVDTNDACRGR